VRGIAPLPTTVESCALGCIGFMNAAFGVRFFEDFFAAFFAGFLAADFFAVFFAPDFLALFFFAAISSPRGVGRAYFSRRCAVASCEQAKTPRVERNREL
jgi:hypothetical protein